MSGGQRGPLSRINRYSKRGDAEGVLTISGRGASSAGSQADQKAKILTERGCDHSGT